MISRKKIRLAKKVLKLVGVVNPAIIHHDADLEELVQPGCSWDQVSDILMGGRFLRTDSAYGGYCGFLKSGSSIHGDDYGFRTLVCLTSIQ
jgi:hypothetical protein